MSMPKYALHDFIVIVPSCLQTTRLSVVLEIFSKGQCDRLVVVSEQQCPIGVLNLRRLMPQLMSLYGCGVGLDVQQPVSGLELDLVEPIVTLPAKLSVEQFGFYLRSQQFQTNTGSDWALIDQSGKFLGLLDSVRLLQFLASLPAAIDNDELERERVARCRLDSLVHLLEQLPWPLMLQTGAGEVVTQNPAWWQHFGTLSDPEAVRREVEAILENSFAPKAESRSQESTEMLGANIVHATHFQKYQQRGHLNEVELNDRGTPDREKKDSPPDWLVNPPFLLSPRSEKDDLASSSTRCQLGTEPGTCICVWPVQNGQERVWQFVKIPLQETGIVQESEGKSSRFWIRNSGSSALSTDLWLLLAQDVTEQQQVCKELAAKNADLIQLNRLKDEFLACISHELKTPLTAVLGLSTLLKDQALGKLNERQARYARLIYQSGRHLMTVVNDILDLTRMETGQLKLTLEPVQIETVCDRAINQASAIQAKTSPSSTAGETLEEPRVDHRFTILIEPGLDSFVADELRLRQMLVHLLSNAFKFTEAGGEIGLRVNRWEGWIAFTVWDTGIGIPEQKQHLIFQKFQQLENPLTRQFEGTGLGLVLTRALARLHGGDVSFLSKEGKGSQFTLLLPPSPPKTGFADGEVGRWGGGERTSPHPPTSSKRLVLVVEAAPRFIEDLTEQLTDLGYRVVIARSGTEALEKARRLQPGAVFLNPLLPLLSGWDVLTLLKSDTATRHLPVIITATRAEKEQAFLNRADDFLSLPVQQQVLQQILTRFCATIPFTQSGRGVSRSTRTDNPLTILRLVTPDSSLLTPDSSLLNYRVLEADDLEQAELLARFWQPEVILLDAAIPDPLPYLKQLSQHPILKGLPLVTLNAATTQAANQVTGLSVFPCLTPVEKIDTDTLLPVLQIAAGMSWKPSLLVVDVATLPDLPLSSPPTTNAYPSKGSEWFQALIQYLQTAGFRGMRSRSWAEVLQQIKQQSVDLLLICLGDSRLHPGVLAALTALNQQHDLPPVLVLDQRLGQGEVTKQFRYYTEGNGEESSPTLCVSDAVATSGASDGQFRPANVESDAVESLETVLGAIATQILPPSLSMEELLNQIHLVLRKD